MIPEQKKPAVKVTAKVFDFSDPKKPDRNPDDILVEQKPTLTPKEREEIELENERRSRLPVKKLGKAGDVIYLFQDKITILERTDQLMFIQVEKMLPNPDGSVPAIPNSKRLLDKPYWDIRSVTVRQEYQTDAYEQNTLLMTEPKECILMGHNIELTIEDENGIFLSLGYNADRERVHEKYLETVAEFETKKRREVETARRAKIVKAEDEKRHRKLIQYKIIRSELLGDLRSMVAEINPDFLLKNKKMTAKLDDLIRIERIIEIL